MDDCPNALFCLFCSQNGTPPSKAPPHGGSLTDPLKEGVQLPASSFILIHYTHMQLSSWNGVMKSNAQIYCCHGKVALSEAYNYYQLRNLSGTRYNLVPGPCVHPMYAIFLCNALIQRRIGLILVCRYSSTSCICAPGSSDWSPSSPSTSNPQ